MSWYCLCISVMLQPSEPVVLTYFMIVRGEISPSMEKMLILTEREQRNKFKKHSLQQRVFFFVQPFCLDLFGCVIILNCKLEMTIYLRGDSFVSRTVSKPGQ
jgi:hypothetical protein